SMPELTGCELARAVRAVRPDIPVVLMSGFVSPALAARARDLGITEVLSKPLVERDIARGLDTALHRAAKVAA
ncbi:MAG: response regulator, partial [Betaproteobacteria bacterium]|nr:response regulator [Betaproteobacteria bacterium]